MGLVARFGKHKGKTEDWVRRFDPKYLQWAKANTKGMFGASQEVKPQSTHTLPKHYDELPEEDSSDPSTPSGLYALALRRIQRDEL